MSNLAINIKELIEIMDNDRELIQNCFSDFINNFEFLISNSGRISFIQN